MDQTPCPRGLSLYWDFLLFIWGGGIFQLHSFGKQSLSTRHVLGTVLSTGDSEMIKDHFCPLNLPGRQTCQQSILRQGRK